MLRIGGNSPTQGYTQRARDAAAECGPGIMLWMPSADPANATPYADCVQVVRLGNWSAGMSPPQYVEQERDRIERWRAVLPAAIFQLGNEPDAEAGHMGEDVAAMAAELHARYPGIRVGNPPLKVENSQHVVAGGCDAVLMHTYFERQHPDTMSWVQFGRSYKYGLQIANGRPVYVTECNVVQTNCPIDWHDRNLQLARLLDQMEADGVAGACIFIFDANGDPEHTWDSYDTGPEAMRETLALRTPIVTPPAPPPPAYDHAEYAWDGAPPLATYRNVVRDGSLPGMESPLLDAGNADALMALCAANDTHWLVPLAWYWEEGHEMTDPGLVAARVNNPAGIKWVPGLGNGAYDSGIPADTGGTYAGYPTLANFFASWFQTMRNRFIGPYFDGGDLQRAANAYVNGPQFAERATDANGNPINRAAHYRLWRAALDAGHFDDDAPAPTFPLIFPVEPPTVTQGSDGAFSHGGVVAGFYAIDYACERGTPCVACAAGTVGAIYTADWNPVSARTGPSVWIDHDNGYSTFSCHLSRIDVATGQRVAQGAVIGLTGDPTIDGGYSGDPPAPRGSDPHLHWEVWDTARHVRLKMEDLRAAGIIGSGSAAPAAPEVDMRVDGHMDDGKYAMQWHGPNWSFATGKPKKGAVPLNPESGAYTLWKSEFDAGRPLGYALSKEMHNAASADKSTRFIQVFSNGNIEGNRASPGDAWVLSCN